LYTPDLKIFIDRTFRAGMGNLFIITGGMNCA